MRISVSSCRAMMATVYGFAMLVLFVPNVRAVGSAGRSPENGCALDEDEIEEIATAIRRTTLDLAVESGFSSKSTFNRAFKERYGSAPSVYLG